jgi:hypothetical protein
VTTTVVLVVEADAEQLVKDAPRTTVGEAGTENALLKTIVMVLPAPNVPPEPLDRLNETVQSVVVLAACEAPVKETLVTAAA